MIALVFFRSLNVEIWLVVINFENRKFVGTFIHNLQYLCLVFLQDLILFLQDQCRVTRITDNWTHRWTRWERWRLSRHWRRFLIGWFQNARSVSKYEENWVKPVANKVWTTLGNFNHLYKYCWTEMYSIANALSDGVSSGYSNQNQTKVLKVC